MFNFIYNVPFEWCDALKAAHSANVRLSFQSSGGKRENRKLPGSVTRGNYFVALFAIRWASNSLRLEWVGWSVIEFVCSVTCCLIGACRGILKLKSGCWRVLIANRLVLNWIVVLF